MNCPLCNTKENLIIRRTKLLELRAYWLSSFNFDPFPIEFSVDHIDKLQCSVCHLEYFDPPNYGDADFYAKLSKTIGITSRASGNLMWLRGLFPV